MKTEKLSLGNFHGLFNTLNPDTVASQEFIEFIMPQGKKNENVSLLLDMERQYPGIFAKVMSEFDKAKEYRKTLDENGLPKNVSWRDAFEKFYLNNSYENITEENQDIAETYKSKGVKQQVFEEGVKLREEAKKNKIPEHILGKELKETSILEQIERLKESTEVELVNIREIIDELYNKNFTYEWFNKNDPKNGIIGLYTSCCATISGGFYGNKIARTTITARDVQNLVVRNAQGDIVSKGTIYVNEANGYAVFNDFELNEKYRVGEIKGGTGGRYSGDDKNEDELSSSEKKERKERDLIFGAFSRGIAAFIEEYDKQHPNNPLKQINVGMGYNRLKRNVEQFEEATELLSVPAEYEFEDAAKGQRILYKRKEQSKEENER